MAPPPVPNSATSDPAIEQRFKRIHESLSAGVDLKRRVVEELRPTLLDNMGLFAALRWQFKETCRRTGLNCTETIPDSELVFNPDAAIGVFRIAQEALTNILKHAEAKSADLAIGIHGDTFVLRDRTWIVVGILKSAGLTFNSEIWAKRSLLAGLFGKDTYTSLVLATKDDANAKERYSKTFLMKIPS